MVDRADQVEATDGVVVVRRGRAFGMLFFLDEVVTEREMPRRKVWETVGEPRLLVIGPYRMGFEITPSDSGVLLHVSIDYELPSHGISARSSTGIPRIFSKTVVHLAPSMTQAPCKS